MWIPGSYLVREFSQHLLNVRAEQAVFDQLMRVDGQGANRQAEPGPAPVFILGQSMGLVIYLRNLQLIARHRRAIATPTAP